MWDLRKKLFIIIGIIAGFLIVIILWAILSGRSANTPSPADIQGGTLGDGSGTLDNETSTDDLNDAALLESDKEFIPPPPENQNELYARQSARLFVERFLSYSNQGENGHIQDVLPLATARMQNWIKTQGVEQSSEYSGISTRVVTSEVRAISANSATVGMGLQQIIQSMKKIDTVNKNARVELAKQGDEWKVDALYFEE